MADIHAWGLAERPTFDGGALCFWWHANLCAAGTMCIICGDIQPASEQTKTHKVQPGGYLYTALTFTVLVPLFYYSITLPSFLFFWHPQVASLIGSSSVLFCGMLSRNMEDFSAFQAFSVLIAFLSCGCMLYTGVYSDSRFDNKGSETNKQECLNLTSSQSVLSMNTLKTQVLQILTNRDFLLFVTMNFFEVFMLAFLNNFTMIFAEHLIPPDALTPLAKSVMYGAGFICPQVRFSVILFSTSCLTLCPALVLQL